MSRRQKKRNRPGGGGFDNANVRAGRAQHITGWDMLSTGLQAALSGGKKRYRLATSFSADGSVGPVIYFLDNLTRKLVTVRADALADIAGWCNDPSTADHIRHLHAQYKAEQCGQVGHA